MTSPTDKIDKLTCEDEANEANRKEDQLNWLNTQCGLFLIAWLLSLMAAIALQSSLLAICITIATAWVGPKLARKAEKLK